MNPQLAALRRRHDGLATEHDEMRAHAVTLVQKCRQAESVNGALQRECSRLRSAMHGGGGDPRVRGSPLSLSVHLDARRLHACMHVARCSALRCHVGSL
jgi:hypothetical protein